MINRKHILAAGVAALVGLVAAHEPAESDRSKSFTFVYNSDTRGYYRPCG